MPTVMVVDDTAIVRETVAKLLRREGFQTVCAANGQEALAALRLAVPDVMLLDIMMPVMDGLQCLQELRQDPRWRAMPVIMMSALSDDEHQREAQQLGASDYLVKARFTINQMLVQIRRFLKEECPPN